MTSRRRLRAVLMVACLAAGTTAGGLPHAEVASARPANDPYAAVAYQHDPAHDGDSIDPSFVAPLTTSWSTTLGGTVGYPLIADGRVFVTIAHPSTSGNDVEALSLDTGAVLWGPTSIGGAYSAGRIAYDGGKLFAITFDGRLTSFDAATGAVDWTSQLERQYAFTSAPTAVDGTLYVGGAGSGGTLYAVDEASGVTTWTAGVSNGDQSSPAVDASGVYVSYACEQTYRFDLGGALVWHHETDCEGGGGRTAVLHAGKLYIRDDAGKTPAVLDTATGALVASFDSHPAPAFDDRHMAVVSGGNLTVSDLASGGTLWRTTSGDDVTAPLIANGYVVEGRVDGTVEARNVQDGSLAWSGTAGSELAAPDEHNAQTLTGLAEGDGALVVPAGSTLTVFTPAGNTKVSITRGPDAAGFAGPTATFAFTSAVRNAHYTCTLDGQAEACASPATYSGLSAGAHQFSVSVDDATTGRAARTFQVDASAPVVQLAPFRHPVIHRAVARPRWSATDDLSGVPLYRLRVRRALIGTGLPSWTVHAPTAERSAVAHLRVDWRLCVSVRARDGAGNWSGWSGAACVRRRPPTH